MYIREIEPKDNQQIEAIIKHSLESVGLDIPGTAYFDPQLSTLAEFYHAQESAMYWVAVDDQEHVYGGIGIAPFRDQSDICELQKLYVSSEAQGMGLSKRLMSQALTFAANHYHYCYLETVQTLKTANKLYRKFGFQTMDQALPGSEHGAMDTWYIKDLRVTDC